MDQSTDMHYAALLQYEDLRTGNFNFLAPIPGHLEIDGIVPVPFDFVEVQDNTSIPETDPDAIGPISSLYRSPNSVSYPRSMVQWPETFSQPFLGLTEIDNPLPASWSSDLMRGHPSTMDTPSRSSISQAILTQYPGIGRQGSSALWDGSSLGPVSDHLWLQDQYSSITPSENRYITHDGFEYCMANTPQAVPHTQTYTTASVSEAPINIPMHAIHLPCSNEGISFQSESQRGSSYFSTGMNDELPSLLNYQSTIPKLRICTNLNTEKRPRQLSPDEEGAFQQSASSKRPRKQSRLMAKSVSVAGSAAIGNEKRSGNRGRLSEEERRQRALVRARTACIRCYRSHIACSSADPRGPCDNCVRTTSPPYSKMPCLIGPMQFYHDTLSPRLLNEYLPIAIQKGRDSSKFIENEVEVHMFMGVDHLPIALLACEYTLLSKKPLDATQDKGQILKELPSLNYGIRKENEFQIEAKMRQHINAMSNCSKVMGDRKTLSWKVLSAICRFHQIDPVARRSSLLSNAITVIRLHYILGQSIVFGTDTVVKAVRSLQNEVPIDPLTRMVTAKFLAAQLKGVTVSLLDETTKHLLEEYNDEARRNNSETWLVCLLTHLVLCMCGELVQIQVDGFIPTIISHGNCNPEAIRDAGTELCRRIDQVILNHSWELIRGKLRSRLNKRNPFIYGCQILMDEPGGKVLSQAEQNLINEIRQIMDDDANEITRKLSNPLYGGSSRTLKEHEKFRELNTGRLVASYLRALERKGKVER